MIRMDMALLCVLQPRYNYQKVKDVNGAASYVVSCYEHSISSYAIPDILHIGVYAYCFYLFRCVKTEQLQILMEKVTVALWCVVC